MYIISFKSTTTNIILCIDLQLDRSNLTYDRILSSIYLSGLPVLDNGKPLCLYRSLDMFSNLFSCVCYREEYFEGESEE